MAATKQQDALVEGVKLGSSQSLPVEHVASTAMAVADMEADAGGGFEDTTKDSYAIPFLQILQQKSPAIDTDNPKHKPIPGAVTGGIINTVTEEVFAPSEGVRVFPCHTTQTFVEWVPRKNNGGIVAVHDAVTGQQLMKTTKRVEEEGKTFDRLPNGNDLVDTRNHYVIAVRADSSTFPAVINMSITQTKKSKKWVSTMGDVKEKRADGSLWTPPMWSRAYRLRTEVESKGQNTWRGWSISQEKEQDGSPVRPSPEMYAAAKAFRDAVRAGAVKTPEPREPGSDDDVAF
jgi:hypothetical protein